MTLLSLTRVVLKAKYFIFGKKKPKAFVLAEKTYLKTVKSRA